MGDVLADRPPPRSPSRASGTPPPCRRRMLPNRNPPRLPKSNMLPKSNCGVSLARLNVYTLCGWSSHQVHLALSGWPLPIRSSISSRLVRTARAAASTEANFSTVSLRTRQTGRRWVFPPRFTGGQSAKSGGSGQEPAARAICSRQKATKARAVRTFSCAPVPNSTRAFGRFGSSRRSSASPRSKERRQCCVSQTLGSAISEPLVFLSVDFWAFQGRWRACDAPSRCPYRWSGTCENPVCGDLASIQP